MNATKTTQLFLWQKIKVTIKIIETFVCKIFIVLENCERTSLKCKKQLTFKLSHLCFLKAYLVDITYKCTVL